MHNMNWINENIFSSYWNTNSTFETKEKQERGEIEA